MTNNDLISRSEAVDRIGDMIKECRNEDDYNLADAMILVRRYIIKELPAVDAVPIVHGHWTLIHVKGKEYGKVYYQHENCAPLLFESPYHYCPECGAQMDEQEKDDNE